VEQPKSGVSDNLAADQARDSPEFKADGTGDDDDQEDREDAFP
jgi:hypothetical protein